MKKVLPIAGLALLVVGVVVSTWFYMESSDGTPVYIYRLNTRNNQLEPERRIVTYDTPEEMVRSVILMMYEQPRSAHMQATIPIELLIDEVIITGNVMEFFFPASYGSLIPYREALLRASLTQVMTNLPFMHIEGIHILVDGQEMVNAFGEPFGVQTRESVLVGPNIMPNLMHERTLVLYFVSTNLDGLIPEQRTLDVPVFAVERAIIEQLIAGPFFEGRRSPIAPGTLIRDVHVEGGICTINFSQEFVDNFAGTQTLAYLTLQSIVQTIFENVDTIQSIQFLIEAERRDTFNGVPYFDTLFERDEAG